MANSDPDAALKRARSELLDSQYHAASVVSTARQLLKQKVWISRPIAVGRIAWFRWCHEDSSVETEDQYKPEIEAELDAALCTVTVGNAACYELQLFHQALPYPAALGFSAFVDIQLAERISELELAIKLHPGHEPVTGLSTSEIQVLAQRLNTEAQEIDRKIKGIHQQLRRVQQAVRELTRDASFSLLVDAGQPLKTLISQLIELSSR